MSLFGETPKTPTKSSKDNCDFLDLGEEKDGTDVPLPGTESVAI